jgi:hypothetical protein
MTNLNQREDKDIKDNESKTELIAKYLFCEQAKKFKSSYIDIMAFSDDDDCIKDYENICENMRNVANEMYNDDETDLEDFGDLIQMINIITYEMIKNKKISNHKFQYFLVNVRVYSKKQMKYKYRDYKYNKRKFWNYEDADHQYYEFMEYIWKPSLEKIRQLVKEYRPDYDTLSEGEDCRKNETTLSEGEDCRKNETTLSEGEDCRGTETTEQKISGKY